MSDLARMIDHLAPLLALREVIKAMHHVKGHTFYRHGGAFLRMEHEAHDPTGHAIPGAGIYQLKGAAGSGGAGNLRNHVVHLAVPVFDFFGYQPHPIRADCVHLCGKHPEYFDTPEEVRDALDFAFSRPDFAYPAHGPDGYFSVVRKGDNHVHAVVDLRNEKGQYRVKHVILLKDDQLAQHLGNAETVWSRGSR